MPVRNLEVVAQVSELLWIIARCDVENVAAHRATALAKLRILEARAAELNINDLYGEAVGVGGLGRRG